MGTLFLDTHGRYIMCLSFPSSWFFSFAFLELHTGLSLAFVITSSLPSYLKPSPTLLPLALEKPNAVFRAPDRTHLHPVLRSGSPYSQRHSTCSVFKYVIRGTFLTTRGTKASSSSPHNKLRRGGGVGGWSVLATGSLSQSRASWEEAGYLILLQPQFYTL